LDLYRKTLNKFNDNYRALQEDIMSFTKDDISDLKVTNISERINDIIEELKRPDLKIDEKFNLYQEEQKLIIDNAKIRIDALKKEY